MNSLRASLSSIPGSIVNCLPDSPITYFNQTATSSSSPSIEDDDTNLTTDNSISISTEKTQAIPNSLIKEEWQLVLGKNPSLIDLEKAIDGTRKLVVNSEECSIERKWLVRHLIELRFQYYLKQIQESTNLDDVEGPNQLVILGHHFKVTQIRNSLPYRVYCDHCTGIIWSILQTSYTCTDCNYNAHVKCVEKVKRICSHIIVTERNYPIAEICPEIGLAAQKYKCAECSVSLNFKNSWLEPRLCDYSGLYYCPSCHWNDSIVIPARAMYNWDFLPKRVCRASLQEINLLLDKAVINLEKINSKLFIFLEKLIIIKNLRQKLNFMRKYLTECRISIDQKILENNIGNRRHLVQNIEFYSIADLIECESLVLNDFLNKIFREFEKHIKNCEICYGKGYICEKCNNNEILFPFNDGAVYCNCNAIYHMICWTRTNGNCSKCQRIEERKNQVEKEITNDSLCEIKENLN